jgi:NAD(P)-dependent dehydrogenase (short-subunit alcohol dehydrogenase family)
MSGYNFDNFLHKLDGETEIQDMLDINIKGNINILSSCLPSMRDRQYGRIILMSSVLAEKVVLGTSLYSGSKAFIDNLVKTASAENIGKGITCNSLQLGYFDGGMCHRLPEKYIEPIKQSIGLKRWGSIEELYKTLEFLINVEYVTGQNINISGGIQ